MTANRAAVDMRDAGEFPPVALMHVTAQAQTDVAVRRKDRFNQFRVHMQPRVRQSPFGAAGRMRRMSMKPDRRADRVMRENQNRDAAIERGKIADEPFELFGVQQRLRETLAGPPPRMDTVKHDQMPAG